MKVFLPLFDLYSKQGGGETIYRQIIALMPDWTFYYLTLDESKKTPRPENTVAIPFNYHYPSAKSLQPTPYFLYENFLNAMNMAQSVARAFPGITFDRVDTPDYYQNGVFIGQALKAHGITAGRVVLAMHGTITNSLKSNWSTSVPPKAHQTRIAALRILENLQYQTVDQRYAISEMYAARWDKKYPGLPCTIIDPLTFLERPASFPCIDTAAKPDIYNISRKERAKGPDIFIDLVWFLPTTLYRRAMTIGPDDTTGQGSDYILERAAQLRGVTNTNLPAQDRQTVMELLQQKAINVVSSRYETLSLSALESLLHGCPTVISKYCGVVHYLKKHHPEIPFYEIDLTCARDGAKTLQYVIENYTAERARLITAVQALPVIDKVAAIQTAFTDTCDHKHSTRTKMDTLFTEYSAINARCRQMLSYQLRQIVKKTVVIHVRAAAKKILGKRFTWLQKLKWQLKNGKYDKNLFKATLKSVAKYAFNDPKSVAQWYFAFSSKRLRPAPIGNNNIKTEITHLEDLVAYRYVDRAQYFGALSQLESQRDNPLMSAVYQSRLLRWQGPSAAADVNATAAIFKAKGYAAEAEALLAIHSSTSDFDAQLALLQQKLAANKQKPDLPLEILDDRRQKPQYKVSIIVSLYNAASKLPTFFRMLDQQTLLQAKDIEVVFVDSGSPTNEYEVIQQYQGPLKDAFVYARSENRESIQAAWNRGIKLSHGQYLTFQAVDEALHPECLAILSHELDENPAVDWVMGSALVAEISKQEILLSDVMAYNRNGAKHHSHIFDCTYINYTPGLYRRSVHEQHGYYDETFKAAGDTEFKNRVLPFINLKFIPNILGAYNNYQEERTTAHPRAEIEDIRAWYLYRTPAGIAYLFGHKSEEELLDTLRDTLGYRKAYCHHISTDIELGLSLCIYLQKKTGKPRYQQLADDYRQLIQLCNDIESLNPAKTPVLTVAKATHAFTRLRKQMAKQLAITELPAASLFHDNRYEQHWWPWRNTI